MPEMNFTVIAIGLFAFFMFVLVVFVASRYRRCPSNKVLCIYGRVGAGRSVLCYHGGGTFVWPLIQDFKYLDLTPITISIPLKGALSFQNIRIDVPSSFTIAIDTLPESMNSAAVRLLQLTQDEIEDLATEIIFGQLRLTVASLTIEQINQDREKFLDAIRSNIDPELRKVGLYLINVNITDITDDSGYIDAIGKKAAATAINQARVDVAEQERKGSVGEADAHREQRIKVAEYNASAVEGENTSQAQIAAYNADLGEKEAEAKRRSEVARQEAEAKIQMVRAEAEQRRLEADEIVQREIDKRMITIAAEAEAEKRRREAAGEADAILSIRTAEAEGIQKILDAKAEGYRRLVIACAGSAREAATMLLVEKLEVIVQLQTEAIKNIKIDKVTVWDTGNSEKGSSTANFLSSMVKSLPALHDIAEMAGVDLPAYLGRVRNDEPGERTAAVSVPEPSGPPPAPTPGTGDGEDS